MVLLSLLGCGGGRASSNASPGPGATLVTPTPPAPWGTFVALDYDKPGHPKLTPDAIALIRKTLAVVKPCQRQMLSYSFDEDDPSGTTIALYFTPSGHVLWQQNWYWESELNRAHPLSWDTQRTPDWSIQGDIAANPCR
jgi:hypothetical protein